MSANVEIIGTIRRMLAGRVTGSLAEMRVGNPSKMPLSCCAAPVAGVGRRTRNRPRRRYGARYPCERSAVRTRSPSDIGLE